MDGEVVIKLVDITKAYGKINALRKINLEIYEGEIFGLFGSNGAGKSTFISIVSTLIRPTEGQVTIKGFNTCKEANKVKPLIGFVPQDIALYQSLSAIENLRFWSSIYKVSRKLCDERINEALSFVDLQSRAKDKVSEYSGGMKRRLNMAVALLHKPEILILDEPTAGVDMQSRKYMLDAIKEYKKRGTTIIFTSHYLDEMKELCDRVAILNDGRITSIMDKKQLATSSEFNLL